MLKFKPNYFLMMKAPIRFLLFVFISLLFSVSHGTNSTISFQSINNNQNMSISFSKLPNTLKSLKYHDGCYNAPYFIEGILFITGSIIYWDYNHNSYIDQGNKGLGLAFMGSGLVGFIFQSVCTSHYSNNVKYQPCSTKDNIHPIQLICNETRLGIKMSF